MQAESSPSQVVCYSSADIHREGTRSLKLGWAPIEKSWWNGCTRCLNSYDSSLPGWSVTPFSDKISPDWPALQLLPTKILLILLRAHPDYFCFFYTHSWPHVSADSKGEMQIVIHKEGCCTWEWNGSSVLHRHLENAVGVNIKGVGF